MLSLFLKRRTIVRSADFIHTAEYKRHRKVRRVSGLLIVTGLVASSLLLPLTHALPGEYTWQKAGVTGIDGDRTSWSSVASSADGSRLAATIDGTGYIWTSADSGATWTESMSAGSHRWQSIVMSADGTELAAVEALYETGSIYTSSDSGATWTERTSAGVRRWQSLAMSSDGAVLVATDLAYYDDTALEFVGSVYTSSDSGATWTERTSAGVRYWKSIAISVDGTKLAAVETHYDSATERFVGSIYTSSDSGATWTERTSAGVHGWEQIVGSIDGTKLVVTTSSSDDFTYTSADGGITWTEQATSGLQQWQFIAAASDATKLIGVRSGSVYTSVDFAASWTKHTIVGSRLWSTIANSADGMKIIAAANGYEDAYIYTSADGGATWTKQTSAGSRPWYAIALSADGTTLAAGEVRYDYETSTTLGSIYTSSDSGATWTERTSAGSGGWQSIALSADGTRLVAADGGGYIYTSSDSGATWIEQTAAGVRGWSSIAMSSNGTRIAALAGTGGSIHLATTEDEDSEIGAQTTSFDYATLDSSEHTMVSGAVLSITSSACYTIVNGSTTVLDPSGVTSPEQNVSILGGIAYSLNCVSNGGSTDATITLGSSYPDLSKLRIYKKASSSTAMEDITDRITLSNQTVNGVIRTVLTYTLTDGGEYDEDGVANGTIVDPLYIGVVTTAPTSSALAKTGKNMWYVIGISSMLVIAGLMLFLKHLMRTQ